MAAASIPHLVAIGAGVLTLAAGAFVLAARPGARLHQLFFLLALADGASTILFRASYLVDNGGLAVTLRGTYWYFFIAFVVLLILFGLSFPAPRWSANATRALRAATVVFGGLLVAAYMVDRELFWRLETSSTGVVSFPNGPAGNLVTAVFVGGLGIVALLLARDLARMPSESHRNQSALVLGGLTLAYGPYATTSLVQGILVAPQRALLTGPVTSIVAYWTFVAYCLVLLVSAAWLLRDAKPERARERRLVLACYAGVLLVTIPVLVNPSHEILSAIRATAFVSYPVLLGYAIVRYEVFDIDRQLRRAATVTLSGLALAALFGIVQNLAENLLQETVFATLSSGWASGALAAIAVAGVSIPVTRVSRKAARRIVPELSGDELKRRKLEVYRHSIAGALADGLIQDRESRTLLALRGSLGITDAEHDKLVAEVRAEGLASAA